MAITPKDVLGSVVGIGRGAVSAGVGLVGRLRGRKGGTSGGPDTVGAAKPGAARGPKSGTAPTQRKTRRPPATATKAPAAKPSASTRAAASRARKNKS
jgi:hypothetical protein